MEHNHIEDTTEGFVSATNSLKVSWKKGISKEPLEKNMKNILCNLLNFIERKTRSEFGGHVKGVLRTDVGMIRFNFVSKETGVEFKSDVKEKIHEAELKIVAIYYDPNSRTSRDEVKNMIEENVFEKLVG